MFCSYNTQLQTIFIVLFSLQNEKCFGRTWHEDIKMKEDT